MTKNEYGGYKRQLAWFARHPEDIYFDVFMSTMHSHMSYHKNGRIFRTDARISSRAKRIGYYLPANDFKGVYQLGTSMIWKSQLKLNPPLEKRHRNKALAVKEVDLEVFPCDIMNAVIEFFEPDILDLMASENVAPPSNSVLLVIDCIMPWIVLTFLGHEHNLLIKPMKDGFSVSHFNDRYSTNRLGVNYEFIAYG